MPATDHHRGSPGPFNTFSRSILTLRRDQIHSIDGDSCRDDVELFQKKVTERFLTLSNSSTKSDGDDLKLLSISWIRKLLDVFLLCQEDFMLLLFDNKSQLNKSPADRVVADLFDRVVKALDVCNAVRDGVEQIKQLQKLIDIVLVALDGERGDRTTLGEGQFRRAKKALIDLALLMLDENESSFTHRNRSFGRSNIDKNHRSIGHLRSLSWSVSRTWSASKQLQAIGSNLIAPRGSDIASSNGLVLAAYTMNSILLFVMWTLVAAIPCQDRGLQLHFNIPRHLAWASVILTLHEQILEESKKRDRKNACGLLREIYLIEKHGRCLSELVDSVKFPLTEVKEAEVRNAVAELAQVYEALNDGLEPLDFQVREVFHRIVKSRTEGLGLGKAQCE